MAIQFPSPVADGYSFTAENGVVYTYDSSGGGGWYAYHPDGLNDVYVNIDGDTMTGDLTVPSLNGGPLAGLRNQIINGDFRVWQRGTDFASKTSPSFTADRWRTAAKRTVKRVKFAGNYGIEVTGTEGNSAYIAQPIELQGDALSGPFIEGKEYTISFTVNNSVAADVRVEMHHRITSNDNTGQQEVVPRTVVASGITATQRVSHTFTYTSAMRPAAAKTCCLLEISNSVGDSTMKITQVQLECGPVATPFEHRPIGLELSLCQRYYQILNLEGSIFNGNSASAGECFISGSLATSMRLNDPTGQILTGGIDLFLNSGRYITAGTGGGASQASITGISNCSNGGSPKVRINRRGSGDSFAGWTVCIDNDRSSARLGLDAEL